MGHGSGFDGVEAQCNLPSDPVANEPAGGRRAWLARDWAVGMLLVATTLVAYLPALRGQFVWDDDSWTTGLAGLLGRASGLGRIWCQPTVLQQYYPLTGTTFWLDYQLWGFWTLPYHLENVLLHALAAVLFWRLLRGLQIPGAGLAGALFALHPVMVESAAWITERKNVLSLVLYLGALLAYGRSGRFETADDRVAAVPQPCARGWWSASVVAWLLFLGALLAKATAFSLPAVILLLSWWKRGRIGWRTEILSTLPFFALSIGLGLITAWLEKHHVGARGPDFAISSPERCLIAGRALWFYAGKLIWPVNLCFVYPRWHLDAGSLRQWLYVVSAVGVLVGLWLAREQVGRGPAAAGFYFAGTLFPVLGLINAYGMRYSFVWDHWVYLSSLGPIALVAALAVLVAERLRVRAAVYGLAAVVLLTLGMLTWRQCRMYADVETLWRATLASNPDCLLAHNNLGDVLRQWGRVDEAIAHFQMAITIQSNNVEAHNNLGLATLQRGQMEEAIAHFQKALEIRPDYAAAHNNLGGALLRKGQADAGMAHFQRAVELQPEYAEAHYNFGSALLERGQVNEAIVHFKAALATRPDLAAAHYNLGLALLQGGRVDEAIVHYQEALKIQPHDAAAHNNLGNALFLKGQVDEAINQYRETLRLKPDYVEASNNLVVALGMKQTLTKQPDISAKPQ